MKTSPLRKCIIGFLFLLTATSNSIFAQSVDVITAKIVASNFLKGKEIQSDILSLVFQKKDINSEPYYYVFDSNNGFVIVSGDYTATPILGYSTEGNFRVPKSEADTIVCNNFWGWMKNYEMQFDKIRFLNIQPTEEITIQWNKLISGSFQSSNQTVGPLLTTTWGQGWPYNAMCPINESGSGGHCMTGCVATAIGQILKYHNYPSQGLGKYGYQTGGYPYTEANFDSTTYNWANMPNNITSVNNDVAILLYHTAISCRSNWGPGETGVGFSLPADPMRPALINYFKMAFSSLKYLVKDNYSISEWDSIIQNELNENRPVYYRGESIGSHAFVCDGVDSNNFYHFNWGWEGFANGYYQLDNITPSMFNFNSFQNAIIGIKPNDGSTLVENTTWAGIISNIMSIAVPDRITLTISPGTTVKFAQNCKLQIFGQLTSIGDSNNYNVFTAIDSATGWLGIKWDNESLGGEIMSDNDTSKLIFSQISFSKEHGLYLGYFNKLIVNNCRINNNDAGVHAANQFEQFNGHGGGIFFLFYPIDISSCEFFNNHSSIMGAGIASLHTFDLPAIISNNHFYNNYSDIDGGGIGVVAANGFEIKNNLFYNNYAHNGAGLSTQFSNVVLHNNKFCNNSSYPNAYIGGTIWLGYGGTPSLINNLISNNSSRGIVCNNSTPLIINNTICYNSEYGIKYIGDYAGGAIKNCIIYGNISNVAGNYQVFIESYPTELSFDHCNIMGGLNGIGGQGFLSISDNFNLMNNINGYPNFVNPSSGFGSNFNGMTADWSLQYNSTCINAGTTDTTDLNLPSIDLGGNSRINDSIIDIGAYEYQLEFSISISQTQLILCKGDSTGIAVVNASGGSSPYTYLWNDGQTNAVISDLKAGIYSVTVTDNTLSSLTSSIIITEPSLIFSNHTLSICSNDSLFLQGSWQHITGIYIDTLQTIFGCDSIIITNLIVNNIITDTMFTYIACESYTAPDGQIYTTSGTKTAIIPNAVGCDSTITINLTVNQSSSSSINEIVCNSYTAPDGQMYTTSGTKTAIIPNNVGCDSIITINLTVNQSSSNTINETVCDSYTAPDGQMYTTSGIKTAIIPNNVGCDSIITINLTVKQSTSSTINETVCNSYTAPDGQMYTTSGTKTAIIPNEAGCDSTITINLTVKQSTSSIINETVCNSYTAPDGQVYTTSGTKTAIIPNAVGCDSTITINLTVKQSTSSTINETVCNSYTAPDGQMYTTSGTKTAIIPNEAGCDSTITINLTVNPLPTAAGTISGSVNVCQGQNSVTYTVPSITNATSYVWTLPNGAIGTSTTNSITINYGISAISGNITVKGLNDCGEGDVSTKAITVKNRSTNTISVTVCDSYTAPDGQTYTTSGTETAIIPNAVGCDSVITINLIVNNSPLTPTIVLDFDRLISSSELGNQWYNQSGMIPNETNQELVLTENGTYYVVVTQNDCSSDSSNSIFVNNVLVQKFDKNLIVISPNPFTDLLNIKNQSTESYQYTMYNGIGQVIFKGTLETEVQLNTSDLARGLYVIKFVNSLGQVYYKVIKQ